MSKRVKRGEKGSDEDLNVGYWPFPVPMVTADPFTPVVFSGTPRVCFRLCAPFLLRYGYKRIKTLQISPLHHMKPAY